MYEQSARRLLAAVGSACVWAASVPLLSAQSNPTSQTRAALEVVNQATVAIADIRLASRAMDHWGANLLATQVQPGEQRRVVPERQEGCLYSIRVVYRDNRFEQFAEIDLCRNNDYLLAARVALPIGNQNAFNAPPKPQVRIVNRASKAVEVIRMSPANTRVWGPNRIAEGQYLEPERYLEVPLDANAGCLFRLRAYYRDGQTGIFPSVDLCEDYAISLGREPTFKSDQEVPPDMRIRIARSATVWNRSGLEIDWIFVAGADEGQPALQGVDRLGNDRVLRAGTSERIDVSDQRSCQVTVKAVYRGKQQSEEKKLDLCASDQPETVMYGR